jgi:hypothetical protein
MKDEALKLALEFIEANHFGGPDAFELITAIKQALNDAPHLAAPVQEPSYWLGYGLQAHTEKPFEDATPVWTSPPVAQPAPVQEPVACKTLCELCIKRGYNFCANAVKTTPIPTPPAAPTSADYAMGYAEGFNDGCKPAPVQEPEHIVHSNGRYSPLLTRMMNKRVESNVKQVIHLYDEPPAQPAPVQELTLDSYDEHYNTTPPAAQRQWVGLTDEDIEQEFGFIDELLRDCVQRTEAKLKEKNT